MKRSTRRRHSALRTGILMLIAWSAYSQEPKHADDRLRKIDTEWAWRTNHLVGREDWSIAPGERIPDRFPKVDAATQQMRLHYWADIAGSVDAISSSELTEGEQLNYDVYRFQVAALVADPRLPEPAKREFITGQAGTLPRNGSDLARSYFNRPDVRRLIYALESGPLTERAAQDLLRAGGTHLGDLIRVKLVRNEGQEVRLAFAYFTASDMRKVHAVISRFVRTLVAAYRAKRGEFAVLWEQYPVRSVSRDQLAFDLIAGVGLNWDGLEILAKGDLRRPLLVSGLGWRYSFFASEVLPDYSYRGYYWGSSAFPADLPDIAPPMPAAFASFGDPDSDPRMNFPDLLGLPRAQMSAPVRAAAGHLRFRNDAVTGPGTLGIETGRQIGRLLLALRARSSSAAELQRALPGDPIRAELELLQSIAYVRLDTGGRFELTVTVLDDQDRTMLSAVRELNKRVISRWLEQNYAAIRAQLTDLTAIRQGVAYEALFTQIWHEIFGLATRELVAAGEVGDPYAPANPAPGSLAMVWKPDLLQREWR